MKKTLIVLGLVIFAAVTVPVTAQEEASAPATAVPDSKEAKAAAAKLAKEEKARAKKEAKELAAKEKAEKKRLIAEAKAAAKQQREEEKAKAKAEKEVAKKLREEEKAKAKAEKEEKAAQARAEKAEKAAKAKAERDKPVVHNGTYGFPWAKGKTFHIDNAFNGYGAHQGDWGYAVDFKMPEGTEICAARAGVVIAVVANFSAGGNDPSLGDKANYLYIKHDDRSIGRYLHFKQNGALVALNDQVAAGQVIAHSGNVGWSTDPHLHFDIIVPKPGGGYKTIPFQFKSPQGKLVTPKLGLELKN
jgi:murein DD-endopeptidase MepM/ murein hydrolase activator NlpD